MRTEVHEPTKAWGKQQKKILRGSVLGTGAVGEGANYYVSYPSTSASYVSAANVTSPTTTWS